VDVVRPIAAAAVPGADRLVVAELEHAAGGSVRGDEGEHDEVLRDAVHHVLEPAVGDQLADRRGRVGRLGPVTGDHHLVLGAGDQVAQEGAHLAPEVWRAQHGAGPGLGQGERDRLVLPQPEQRHRRVGLVP
jgi:hypothetical protein